MARCLRRLDVGGDRGRALSVAPAALDPAPRRAALGFIFVTVLIDILSFGIIIPVLPHLVERLTGGQIARAALWVGLMQTMFALIQFASSPVQGAASDRFGRRRVILISNLGLGLDFVVMALTPSLWLLFVGRAVSGLTSASFSTANAYIADVTPREMRASAFGLLGAAFGIGFVLGPALGGLLGHFSIRLPFWVAAGLSLSNFCYGVLVLPESLPPEQRTPRFLVRDANPLGALALLRRYPKLVALAILVFIGQLAHFALQSTFVLYADYRYGWGPQAVGYTLALVGVSSGLVQGVAVGRLVRWLGERATLLLGLGFGIAGMLMMGLATSPLWFLLAIPLVALWGLANPPTRALMSGQVSAREQGRLQGAVTSLMSLAGVFGPSLFTSVFAAFIGSRAPLHLPGAAFLLAALLVGAALIVAVRALSALAAPSAAPPATTPKD